LASALDGRATRYGYALAAETGARSYAATARSGIRSDELHQRGGQDGPAVGAVARQPNLHEVLDVFTVRSVQEGDRLVPEKAGRGASRRQVTAGVRGILAGEDGRIRKRDYVVEGGDGDCVEKE